VSDTEAREAERMAAERAAFRARITHEVDAAKTTPHSRRPIYVLAAIACAIAATGVALVVRHKPKPVPTAVVASTQVAVAGSAPAAPPVITPPATTPMGIIKIATTPPGATLFLDGKKLDAVSPVTVDAIAAGKSHVLLATLSGHWDALTSFTLADNEVRPIAIKLRESAHHARKLQPIVPLKSAKAAAPAPTAGLEGEGMLLLASSPWCNVSIDGVSKGPTPVSVKLRAGKHTVVLSNPEFKISRTLPVLIMPNQTLRKRLDFN
jgi:hypothetical protein